MNSSKCWWYNGISSKPQEVIIAIDPQEGKLLIQSEEEKSAWLFQNIKIEIASGTAHIYNTGIPGQSLQCNDREFYNELLSVTGNNPSGWYHKLLQAGLTTHITIALAVVAFIGAAYFLLVPWIAEKAVAVLPESYDNSMGSSIFENYIQYEEVDSAATVAMQEFADNMDFGAGKELKITVVISDEKNAFALPDGNIVVYTPILSSMNDYPELAALLAHEAAHVRNRHSMKILCRNISGYLLISALLSDVNGMMAIIADNANQLRMLSYSRGFEKEADENGFQILQRNKINPQGMIDLFNHLKEDKDFDIPDFLSTHPLTDDRIRNIKRMIKENRYSVTKHAELSSAFSKIRKSYQDVE